MLDLHAGGRRAVERDGDDSVSTPFAASAKYGGVFTPTYHGAGSTRNDVRSGDLLARDVGDVAFELVRPRPAGGDVGVERELQLALRVELLLFRVRSFRSSRRCLGVFAEELATAPSAYLSRMACGTS